MKPARTVLFFALAILLATSLASSAWAQTQATSGNLQGIVSDPDGNPLPGVTITVTGQETGRVRTTITSTTGNYRVPLLPTGVYSVRAELTGFQPVERTDIRVRLGAAQEVGIQMALASVQEVLIVTGQAPVIETSKTQVSTSIDEAAIDSLPILGRNFTDFTLLTPGAQIEASRNTVALSGQRGVNTSVNIDGASDNSAFFGYQRGGTDSPFTVSQESVQEFQVITSGIMPEFGRSGGGLVNVVTKSGTNQWRGGGHLFWRDESLTSSDPFDREQAEFSVKQFGGNVGGPLQRNEHFFFASVDVQDFSTPFFVDYDLSDAEFAQLESYVNVHRPDWDISQSQFSRTNDVVVPFLKTDFTITDNTQLTLRLNYSNHKTINGGTDTNLQGTTTNSVSSLGDQAEKTVSAIAQVTSVLGDRAFNELRVQYANDDLDRLSNDLAGPDTDIRNPFVQLGRRFFMPIFVDEKKFQVQDNFSYLFDDHDIKIGVDFETDKTSEFFAAFPVGEYRFSSLPEFLANEPDSLLQSFGVATPDLSPNFNTRQSVLSFYAQDSWRASNTITINYGLRWEGTMNPNPTGNAAFPETLSIPDDMSGWQPRAGIAYAPDPRTVFRASAGRFVARTPTLLFFAPFTSIGEPGVGVFFIPGFGGELDGIWPNTFDSLPTGITADQEVYWFDDKFVNPRTWRFNLGAEREVIDNLSLGVSMVHARSDTLQTLSDKNLIGGGRDAFGRFLYNGRITDGQIWKINESNGRSRYTAAIFEFKKRFSDGWGAFGSYTAGWDKDNDSNERSSGGTQPSNIFDLDEDWGFSDRSIRHRIVVSAFGDLPAGFKLAGTFVWRTGVPYNALSGDDLNGDNEDDNDRAVVNGQIPERNAFRQPDFKNVDIRVTKEFNTSAGRFQAFAEVFNLFNFENLFTTRDEFNSRFGDLNTFIGNVRQLQLGFKYVY
ncbi:MAG TPA: TonB-dependent receptor [Acidobacteriota bacterium]|nr:TonB-dependent receptor [Acidobacteriota bacterium]